MRLLSISLLAGLATIAAAPSASAQSWGRGAQPQAGACFYEDIDFRGRYICTRLGDGSERVPSKLNDEISSIRIIGHAEVIVFRDGSMRGDARRFTSGVRDLRDSGFNDRLTSFIVQPRGYGDRRGYGNQRGYGNDPYGDDRYGNRGHGRGHPGYGYPDDGYGDGRYDDGRFDNGRDSGRYDNGRYGDGRYDNGRYDRGRDHQGGSRWTYQQAAVMVQQAYRRVLGRDPDQAAHPWVEEVLKNNWSQRQLEQALRDTPEGRGR